MTADTGRGDTGSGDTGSGSPIHDEYDRQRRRVLWSLPTGLYLIGSRHGDTVNLMTANLVVQVCLEPKLVAVAVEAGSVTADLIGRGNAFTVSLLARQDKDVVRRFVKPVHDVERDATGAVTALSGHEVREVGPVPAAGARGGVRLPGVHRGAPGPVGEPHALHRRGG